MSATMHVGELANMKAELITRFKGVAEDSGVMELVVWRVPRLVPPTEQGYKYRAVYAVEGVRVVGFDNERGKGDYCHLHGQELPYTFTTVGALVEDFIAAVDATKMLPFQRHDTTHTHHHLGGRLARRCADRATPANRWQGETLKFVNPGPEILVEHCGASIMTERCPVDARPGAIDPRRHLHAYPAG